jgi:hypothetical protein
MSNSSVLTSRDSQTEIITDSTLIDDTSISDKLDIPILLKSDDPTSSISSHVDENNENEAVC